MKQLKLVLLMLVLLVPAVPAQAQSLPWIEDYTLKNYSTGQTVLEWDSVTDELLQNAPVLAGDEYIITFTLNVRQTVDNAVLELKLSSYMDKMSEEYYWDIETPAFPETDDFNPASRTINFHHIEGVYVISGIGRIATDTTVFTTEGVTLHKPLDLTLVNLDGPVGTEYDHISTNIIDSAIDDYRFLLGQKEAELQDYIESNVDPAYIQLYENFVALAEEEAGQGLVTSATNLLNNLEVEAPPVQTGPSFMEKYFIPTVGGLFVISALGIFMFIRTNSRLGFIKMVVEDQIREMEAVQSRASRIDRTLAQRLDDINDRLKETERA
ncbi:hypothetical protein HN807_03605 [Candidatus Bathyarchaeota archaeon]|nr:hypothetical protein [Candidatus Bathyarchaeota archaeon]MBT4321105.1 hypothetical protein [Candidatus Bathyarchaeota archaeon]MBT5642714.1 hypothetical protein [Candidatus Bathyarchaeota archaeon]MBT6603557.1 hypothetical protein [Candidatus Bathyarchaeota archaeon]MBT7188399.1 hypothetical protein [Candidatus Bathyarchaeota archaeon]